MRRIVMAFMGLLLISGCGMFGGAKPESVNQSFMLAYALIDSANNTTPSSEYR